MKYIVIQGRMPQNGEKAKTALIMFPAWVSPTLVCAGVTGRIIELTDGNIIEQGNAPMSEQEVLDGLRIDAAADLESQAEPAPTASTSDIHPDLNALLLKFGAKPGAAYLEFLQAELEELAQFRKDRPETLKQLQLAHDTIEDFGGFPTPTLSDEAIDALFDKLPGGVQGFLKEWGYRQFAREVEARVSVQRVKHDPLRLQEFGTLEEAQAAHDALADKYDEMHEMLIQRTTQRDALYTTALNNLNTLRDK